MGISNLELQDVVPARKSLKGKKPSLVGWEMTRTDPLPMEGEATEEEETKRRETEELNKISIPCWRCKTKIHKWSIKEHLKEDHPELTKQRMTFTKKRFIGLILEVEDNQDEIINEVSEEQILLLETKLRQQTIRELLDKGRKKIQYSAKEETVEEQAGVKKKY